MIYYRYATGVSWTIGTAATAWHLTGWHGSIRETHFSAQRLLLGTVSNHDMTFGLPSDSK